MKVLLINGSPNEFGCTYTALNEACKVFAKEGIETEIVYLGKAAVNDCIACRKCTQTGKCVFDDAVNTVAEKMKNCDGIIIGSPVYYAAPSARICAFLDRLFFSAGNVFTGKLGASVVSCRRGGASAAFDRLNKYFGISNMHTVGSQYWNQVHGNTPEEVIQDEEGMQTVRTLAQNFSWLLRCIEAGEKTGVKKPVYEAKLKTNYIR